MSKLISISLDVTKIPRDKIIAHKNGSKYVALDVWINDDPDQFGNDCSVNIRQTKEERDAKGKKTYCGNGKKSFGFSEQQAPPPSRSATAAASDEDFGEVPF